MRYIVDLHVHSKFSRACSKNLTLSNLAAWARVKGIDVLATSDFTHPSWVKEMEEKLEPAEAGLYRLKPQFQKEDGEGNYEAAPQVKAGREVRFILGTEISCIYKRDGKTRRLHHLVLFPELSAVKKFIAELEALGCNLRSDGRPIVGLDSQEIAKVAFACHEKAMLIPAHAWTPWFSVFGSESGFDSLEACFGDWTKHIHAIETGLSSDPGMNRRLSALDNIALISNSDAHGLRNLGREANVFSLAEISYASIMNAIIDRDPQRFVGTIEFFPEEGKYHVDGHRACDFHCLPDETIRLNNLCPKCGKSLTRGVLGRVHVLADRPIDAGFPAEAVPFKNIIPLEELIADVLGKGKTSKAARAKYGQVISRVGPEFHTLLDAEEALIVESVGADLARGIIAMRNGQVEVQPGYDGVYGTIHLPHSVPVAQLQTQLTV